MNVVVESPAIKFMNSPQNKGARTAEGVSIAGMYGAGVAGEAVTYKLADVRGVESKLIMITCSIVTGRAAVRVGMYTASPTLCRNPS